jgi:CubicO group peptidase (beta-lactamase class C family)
MAAGFSEERLARIAPVLAAKYIEPGLIPGALTLIWRRGEVAHSSLGGSIDLARGTAMREDAIFRIYSMTKPITSVALLMLLEEGKVALDDPVCRFIPGFGGLGVFAGGAEGSFTTRPPSRPMLVIDLLRHTSGLTYDFMNRTPVDAAYRKHTIGAANTAGGLAGMIAQLEKLPLEFSPGEAWNYSLSTDVVGYLVELISGQRFGDFMRSRILRPLGMTDTDFFVPEEKRGRFAACYVAKEGRLDLYDDSQTTMFGAPPKLESGGGGLVSTGHDYLRFCRMMLGKGELDGVRLLSPKTVALMTMNHLPGGKQMTEMMASTAMFNETGYSGVGFGLGVSVTLDLAAARLPGSVGEYAWGGAAATAFFIDPKEDMAVIFMTQVLSAPDRVRLRRDLRTLVYSAMTESFA